MVKDMLRPFLNPLQRRRISAVVNDVRSIPYGSNLKKLAKIYQTDKCGSHYYTPHFHAHFGKHRYRRIALLEIGVGGDENHAFGGHSLRMWKRYFPFANIYGIDIHDKSRLQERRIRIFRGNQSDTAFLGEVLEETGGFDIVIDDGSHRNEDVIKTFEFLFPRLASNGVYVVEDTQTSYWKHYGGDHINLGNPTTIMGYFKNLIDGLNYEERPQNGYSPTYYDRHIIALHFYHNLIFIMKGENAEGSNLKCQ